MELIDPNQWWGVLAAAGCGLGFRFMGPILGATGFAGAVAIVGACFIAMIDAGSP